MKKRQSNKLKILFLGQCIAAGFSVGESNAYPSVSKALLQTRFPTLDFEIDFRPLLHPSGLKPLLKASMALKPDIIFLSLPAIFAAIPFRVNSLYLLSPDVMNLARAFVRRIESSIGKNPRFARLFEKKSVLMPTMVRPALPIDDYEHLIEEAIIYCQQSDRCRLVLMGPGGFNEDTKGNDDLTPELFQKLNEAILRLGARMGVAVVNANDAMAEQDSKVFLHDNQRWSAAGHRIMAQELTSVLASEIIKLRFSETS